ncbi:MAG: HAD family hydrolase [Anaerolineae bacterium]|nr:HAD family hydrolase [Anaerolineae bacterium]
MLDDKRWLFFDLGSTLIDEDSYLRARDDLLRRLLTAEVPVDLSAYAEILRQIKNSLPHSVAKAVLAYYLPDDQRQRILYAAYKESLKPLARQMRVLYPDALPALSDLRADYSLGVIADQEGWVRGALAAWGLADHFSVVVLSAEVGFAKPDHRLFEAALRQACCAPGDAVMLGDRPDKDIAPAKVLGMGTVRIRRGLDFRDAPPRSDQERAMLEIDSLDELGNHHPIREA